MKIALCSPMSIKEVFVYGEVLRVELLGILYISSFLKKSGHETLVVDQLLQGMADQQLIDTITEFSPDIVALTVTSLNYRHAIKIATILKNKINVFIVAGGYYPTSYPEIVSQPSIDLAVFGEGELTMEEIVRHFAAKKNMIGIDGTAWLEKDEVQVGAPRQRIQDLDTIPFPDRRFFKPEQLQMGFFLPVPKRQLRPMTIITSRGCGHRCGFCFSPMMWGGKWIGRSPENVVEEIRQLKKEFGVKQLFFMDEEINFDRRRALDMYRLMREEKLDIEWITETTVVKTDLEVAEAMINAGMTSLFIGYESGAPDILEKLGKRYDLRQGLELTKFLQRRGIFTSGNFMIGLPWEDHKTLKQTRQYARLLSLDVSTVTYHRPQHGTKFTEFSKKMGLFDSQTYDEMDYNPYKPSLKTLYLSAKEVEKAVEKFMFSTYIHPSYWFNVLVRSIRHPNFINSYFQFWSMVVINVFRSFKKRGFNLKKQR